MSMHINAFSHTEWSKYGLADYGDFSDMISEINMVDYNDHSTGTWFYIPDELLAYVDEEEEKPHYRVIYHGTWGNYNSPGASNYTNAEIYDMNDEDDVAEFEAFKEELENADEWAEVEECEHNNAVLSDKNEPATYYCPDCGEDFIHEDDEDEDEIDTEVSEQKE